MNFVRLGLTAALSALAAGAAAQEPQRPVIRSGVELVAVDVQVVDREGRPIETLGPDDFEVLIDGRRRDVVSAELVRHEARESREAAPTAPARGLSEPPAPAPGRRFILAIDEHSFHPLTARAAMQAARLFIEQLQPNDLVGLYTYPTGSAHSDLTDDHAAVIRALDGVTGLLEIPLTRYRISTSEAIDIASGNTEVQRAVQKRECSPYDPTCPKTIWVEAMTMAQTFEMRVSQSLGGLRALFDGLKALEGRKTLVLVSAGLLSSDNAGGRVKMSSDIQAMGAEAARSNTNLYVLHIDWSFMQAYAASNRSGVSLTLFRDMSQNAAGLEQFADAGGGAYIRVQTGAGERGFERILRENAAYYLLGVAVEPSDRDGQPHRIQVRTRQRGATVRSRAFVIIPTPR